MTIVAGAACPEGLVLAGDSRSSVDLPNGRRSASDYASKVYEIEGKFAAATFGWGILEGKTISGHVRDFEDQTGPHADVGTMANELAQYMHARVQAHIAAGFDPAPPPGAEPLGFLVAGYDAQGVGHIYTVLPHGQHVVDHYRTNAPGGIWNGEIDVMIRLLKGYDGARLDTSKWAKRRREQIEGVEYLTPFNWFAMQDAIDWTVFVCRTTIDAQRFTNGTRKKPGAVPTCGGEIEVLTVTWGDGASWVRRSALRA